MNCLFQVELLHESGKIVGVGVHVVADPGLAGAAMAAAVMRDAAIPARGEEEHLVFEGIGGEGPAMAEYHRLPVAPILVIDTRSVLGL
jgi:hypothetical protein